MITLELRVGLPLRTTTLGDTSTGHVHELRQRMPSALQALTETLYPDGDMPAALIFEIHEQS